MPNESAAEAKELREVLTAIESALDGERNRFGKLEHYTCRDAEPLRLLAVKYGTPGARDVIEQAVQVARAVLAKVSP